MSGNNIKLTMPAGCKFKCIVPDICAPCVVDSRFDKNLVDGLYNGKLIRSYKQKVTAGDVVPWVGIESRDQFEAINDEAKKLNASDRKYLIKELSSIGADVPDDATLGELGKTYNRYDPRLAHVFTKASDRKKKTRLFELKKGAVQNDQGETEIDRVKRKLTELGETFHHAAGLKKLQAQLDEAMQILAED